MVEALFILFIAGTAFLVWVVSRAPDVPPDPAAELERLQMYVQWLEDRWQHAEAQNYDDAMKAQIAGELWQASEQLDAARETMRQHRQAA